MGKSLPCAIYNDIKSNNTSPDKMIGEGSRATDSDIATLGSVVNDPGDLTCPGVNYRVEDEFDSLKANPSTESPETHIKGPP